MSFDVSRLGQKACFKPDGQGKSHLNIPAVQGGPHLPRPVFTDMS